MINDKIKRKYSFLTPYEFEVLCLIAKWGINYNAIKKFGYNGILKYLKKYKKEYIKLNKNNPDINDFDITNENVNVLFLIKKHNISLKKVYKILKIKPVSKIKFYPNEFTVISNIKKQFIINKTIAIYVIIMSLIIIGVGILNIYHWNDDNIKYDKMIKKINGQVIKNEVENIRYDNNLNNISEDNKNFDKLSKINPDFKGWINVNGTKINYPFVQTEDNDFYLNHSFDKSKNKKGWVFLDFRNNIENLDNNTILYAHGAVNNIMFGTLKNVVKKSWYTDKNNYLINIETKNRKYIWKVFSTYTIEPENYYISTVFDDDDEYNKFLKTIKERSIYDYKVDLYDKDKVLTLSSCYDASKRVVLHAKLIEEQKK